MTPWGGENLPYSILGGNSMEIPDDIREYLTDGEVWWIDSISSYGYFDGEGFTRLDGERINLTWDDISTMGSCLGL